MWAVSTISNRPMAIFPQSLSKKTALVIGFGSIGRRHAGVLRSMGLKVGVFSRREIDHRPRYHELQNALDDLEPSYVVVANETGAHRRTLAGLKEAGFRGWVLAEKPLFDEPSSFNHHPFKGLFVAYNLRFHPVIRELKRRISKERVLSAHIYAGKYLPAWREGSDYRKSYSAKAADGGGVLRDLSHELDYCNWIFGPWESLLAWGAHVSELEIETADVFCLLMRMKKCPIASLQINYLDRVGRREIVVNTDAHSYRADLVHHILEKDGQKRRFPVSNNDTYRREHEAVFKNDTKTLCTLEEGKSVLEMIHACERSLKEKRWVRRS